MTAVLILTIDTQGKPLVIHFDGDYADVWPLFKFRKIANAPVYIKTSEFRTKYVDQVQSSQYGSAANVIIPVNKPKRLLYHYMLIKMLLLSLDLLELESDFATHWDMDELPMLDAYQFDYWDILLTVYNKNMTPRPAKIVRLFQRRCDQWFNLTAAALEYDGDDVSKKYVSTVARQNNALFEQLELLEAASRTKALESEDTLPQGGCVDKKTSAVEKKMLANKYVDTTWSRQETWCHPIVFNETMMSLLWDWRMHMSNTFVDRTPAAARRELLKPSAFTHVEYFPRGRPINTGPDPESEDDVVGPA